MFGYEQFKKMKRTSYLINVARGAIVDQLALVQALQEGVIAGAGLDTTVDEPLAKDNPLLKMPNAILTGHSAWYSVEADSPEELWRKPMTQVVLALSDKWPDYAVNPAVRKRWLERWGAKLS